ncbi:hypothetical protein [Agathobacter ruminis]|uniref:Alcohol acetyltransferase n=1 Tax=Agathobacter ruminis TaxID=1712665 RepID=A0A2G3E0K2_9FIRM|nr:hypothetical protein [Agathobacter ruminis]MDC7301348.1 hypothetical protein [Agathobacter ruminis]PHU36774.1 hypothetical protein CSX02_11420 [Agathobacter ruminis]
MKRNKDTKDHIGSTHRYIRWQKLDNTALLFPAIAGESMTNVYRISVTLKEPVQPKLLQKALDMVLPKIDGFNVRLRAGVFWYYFEENGKKAPKVTEESLFPCRYIHANRNHSYLFRVTYYQCRINLEVFHVLADGMGGVNFLRELTYQYLRLAHQELGKQCEDRLSDETSLSVEDSFLKNYKAAKPSGFEKKKAYIIREEKLPTGEFALMHGYMKVSELKEVAHRYGVSLNEYLVAAFVYSVYTEHMLRSANPHPIRVAVPVNLRPYFDSDTTRNFFIVVSAEFVASQDNMTFEDVLEAVRDSLREQIQKDHMEDLFSYSVSNQKNKFLRAFPLPLKKPAIRIVYSKSALANTSTITNIGNVVLDQRYADYIEKFTACIAMSKGQSLKGTICSYNGNLCFTFSSVFRETIVQKSFFRKLAEDGIDVSIETNRVYY